MTIIYTRPADLARFVGQCRIAAVNGLPSDFFIPPFLVKEFLSTGWMSCSQEGPAPEQTRAFGEPPNS